MARRKKFGKKRKASSQEMGLNITAMADIFTIILVFLLKSFASGQMNINPSAGLVLPSANASEAYFEALKLEVKNSAISVEGSPIVSLKNYEFDKNDILGNGSSKVLGEKLATERKRQLLISKSNSDVKVDSKVIIIADQETPYSTLKTILASAAVHGYTDYKLAVIRDE
ncbi:MAG: hypothetical protein CL678_08290 [Bdellovibrionaceae bacterium]|nr:hypothetical protein [Pseudobdellovibrionaceae bacterium]|tara:strand:- start:2690 stop:3199 length:510 start_codon:yes stop_codon:yes gene_type:complete